MRSIIIAFQLLTILALVQHQASAQPDGCLPSSKSEPTSVQKLLDKFNDYITLMDNCAKTQNYDYDLAAKYLIYKLKEFNEGIFSAYLSESSKARISTLRRRCERINAKTEIAKACEGNYDANMVVLGSKLSRKEFTNLQTINFYCKNLPPSKSLEARLWDYVPSRNKQSLELDYPKTSIFHAKPQK